MPSSGRLEKRLARAFMVAAAAPLLIAAVLTGYTNDATLRQEMDLHQREAVLSEVAHTSATLRDIEDELGSLAETLQLGLPVPEMQARLIEFVRNGKAYREISIMNSTGLEAGHRDCRKSWRPSGTPSKPGQGTTVWFWLPATRNEKRET